MDTKEIVQIKTRELYHLLVVKDVDVRLAHRLFTQIFEVALYRHRLQTAETPEGEALERWSLEVARTDLDHTLHRMNLCDLDIALVRYVANHYEFDIK